MIIRLFYLGFQQRQEGDNEDGLLEYLLVDGPVPAGSTTRVEMLLEIDDGIGSLLGPASGALTRFRGGRKDEKLQLFPKQIQSQNVEDIILEVVVVALWVNLIFLFPKLMTIMTIVLRLPFLCTTRTEMVR
jgi:hypothetical protein